MPGHHLTGQVDDRALEPRPLHHMGRRPRDQRRVQLLGWGAEAAARAEGCAAEQQQGQQSGLHGRYETSQDWTGTKLVEIPEIRSESGMESITVR